MVLLAILKNTSTILFIHNIFRHSKELDKMFDDVIKRLDNQTAEMKLYLHTIKGVTQ